MKSRQLHSSQEESETFFPLVITALVMVGRYKVNLINIKNSSHISNSKFYVVNQFDGEC